MSEFPVGRRSTGRHDLGKILAEPVTMLAHRIRFGVNPSLPPSKDESSIMRKLSVLLLLAPHPTLPSLASSRLATANDSWPQWRGAAQNGVASGDTFPIRWTEDSGIAWKVELPGNGGSTPVIDGDTAYLTTGVDQQNVLIAFQTDRGSLKWKVTLGKDRGSKHRKGSGSNPSPVVDGDLIYAYFRSGDLACVDRQGEVRWKTNLQESFGEDTLWWDLGSSPLLTEQAIVVAVMQTGPSYLVAFDKKSGRQIWKTDRMVGAPKEAAQSYSTPLAVKIGDQDGIAVTGADHLTIHRASDGRELARLGGFNPGGDEFFRSISSSVAEGNLIVCPYARGGTITTVRLDELANGKGRDAIAWFRDDLGSDVPTPAARQGRVYVVGDKAKGRISCLDIKTGESIWTVQLPKSRIGYSSSPLVAGNHLYVTQENATTHVIGPLDADQPQVVSMNQLDDDDLFTVASPIPLGNSLLLRSRHHLYRIDGE
jgi:outer membrane protein assembly factor BamB